MNMSYPYVAVSQGNKSLCQVRYDRVGLTLTPWWKFKISANVFGGLGEDILEFKGDFEGSLKWIPFHLIIPDTSPFKSLNLDRPWLSTQFDRLQLVANAPAIVGQYSSTQNRTSKSSFEI
jgi:hypothetical protein